MQFYFDTDTTAFPTGSYPYAGPNADNTTTLNNMIIKAQGDGRGLYLTRGYGLNPTNGGVLPLSGTTVAGKRVPFVLEFLPGAYLKNLAHSTDSYNLILVQNVDIVDIVRPFLHGARYENSDATAAPAGPIYGMGMGIYSCGDIKVVNPYVADMYGDGIEIGWGAHDIQVFKPLIHRAIRNGIGVLDCTNLTMWDVEVHADQGVEFDPRAAIDFEPVNGTAGQLQNINIYGLKSFNNPLGVLVDLSAFSGSHAVSININDAWIANAGFSGFRHSATTNTSLTGTINMRRPTYVRCSNTPNNTGDGNIVVTTTGAVTI